MNPQQRDLLNKAQESLNAAKLLKNNYYFDYAVSRAYYAMFYIAEAYLEGENQQFSSHAAVISSFGKNFAKTGNPNGQGLPNWPLYNNKNQDMLDVELDGKVISKPDPRKARFDVVEKAMKNRGKIQSRGI